MARIRQPSASYTYSGERFSDSDSDSESESDKADEFVDASEVKLGSTSPTQSSHQTEPNDEFDDEENFHYPGIDESFKESQDPYKTVTRDWLAPSTSETITNQSIFHSDPTTTQMSSFTLEDFEYLSRTTAKVEQQGASTRISIPSSLSVQKKDEKQEYTCSNQTFDLITFETPNDTTWTSYKPLLPYSNNHIEGVYATALRMPISKRQFRQPVFQEVRREEIPLSDEEEEDEEERELKEQVIEKKYIPPHQREGRNDSAHLGDEVQHVNALNGMNIASKKNQENISSQSNEAVMDPNRGWKDFQPTRPKLLSPVKPTLPEPEKAIRVDDVPTVVCDKCGSSLDLETLRQLLLLQAPVPVPTATSVPTLAPAPPSSPPVPTLAPATVPWSSFTSPEPTAIIGENDLRLDQGGHQPQAIVQQLPRNDILPQLKITTDFELMKVDPSAQNEQFAAAATMWRTRSTPTSPTVMNGHSVIRKVPADVNSTLNATANGRSDPASANGDTTAVWKEINDSTPTMKMPSYSESLNSLAITDVHYTPMFEILDNSAQLSSNGKIPSDLLFGWGPDGNGGQTQSNAIPRAMPASSTVGIGWDDDITPPRPVINEWDPDFAIKKVPSPGYAVSSQRRSPVFSAAPLDRQLAPGLDQPRYR